MIESSSLLSRCSIVVLSHNREDQVRATLENLKIETFNTGAEVIVVDNGSLDRTKSIISDVLVDWLGARVIQCPTNVGISEGRNIGWRAASRDYIISIDDDILISRAMIENLLEAALRIPGFGVLSPTILDSKTDLALNGRFDNGAEVVKFYEACFLIHKSLLSEVGYMDRSLTTAGEGLDFSLRLRQKNFRIIRIFDVVVYHFDRSRSLSDNESRRLTWMWSFARVYWKNLSPPVALFLTSKTFLAHVRSGILLFGPEYVLLLCRESILGALSGWRSRREACYW